MNIVCLICSDGIVSSSEIYTTQCGHLFHYPCLIQWIERSKTCPQCRNKANEKTIHRIYFNLSNNDGNGDDITTLQSKYDNIQFQLMLKEKDLKNFTEKYDKVKCQNITLREEIVELEKKTRVHDSVVHALKDQISFFKSKAKERDRLAEELAKLKMRLKQMESVELVVNGSREEITELLRNENDVESLVILVTTLKKALLEAEKKKGNLEHKVTHLQKDLAKYRKDITFLESSNKEIRQRMELLNKKVSKNRESLPNQTKNTHHNHSEIILDKTSVEDPVRLDPDFVFPVSSSSVEQKNVEVSHSDLSYLPTKRSSVDTDVYIKKSQNFMQAPTGMKQVSIFKRPTIKLDQVKSCKTDDLVYNGLGGQCKEDIYPSSVSTNAGMKRQKFDGYPSSSKLRKISFIPPGKKLNKS